MNSVLIVLVSCKTNYSCAKCGKRHISLHFNREQNYGAQSKIKDRNNMRSDSNKKQIENGNHSVSPLSSLASEFTPAVSEEQTTGANIFSATNSYVSNKNKTVLLKTAICYLCDSFGNESEVRVLLDSGSISNFIIENVQIDFN